MQQVARQTQHKAPRHFPRGAFSNKQGRVLAQSNGLKPATAKDPLAPAHLKGCWEFKPCPFKMLAACRLASERGLSTDSAEALYRELGNVTCAAKTVGITSQALAIAAWVRRDAKVHHAPRAESTYLAYWHCLLDAGALVWGEARRPDPKEKIEVANLVALNGGRALLERMADDRKTSDAQRKKVARKKAALLGYPVETSAQAPVNADVLKMSHYKSQKTLIVFGFQFSKEESIHQDGWGEESLDPKRSTLSRTPDRRNNELRPSTEPACQQALVAPVRSTTPPEDPATPPPPIDLELFGSVMELAAKVGKQAQARAEAEDARPPPARLTAPRKQADTKQAGGAFSARDIAACIASYAPPDFSKSLKPDHPLWTQLANLRLGSAAWDGIGKRMCAAHLAKPIRNLEAYLRACAAKAYQDEQFK